MEATIYFDETGFTGPNLLHPEQIHFVYASVVTSEAEAEAVINKLIKKHKLQGNELKGSSLVNSTKGKRAVLELMEYFSGRMKATVMDKKFALACKFFEYVIEPIIASKSSIFYQLEFHKFVSNMIHLHYFTNKSDLHKMYTDFERFIRFGELPSFISLSSHNEGVLEPLNQIFALAHKHKELVLDEVDSISEWTLDLTTTSLLTLLGEWGEKYDSIKVICDHSKPLKADEEMLNAIQEHDDAKLFWYDKEGIKSVGFNLDGPIQLADSKVFKGIQIADVIAAAISYSLKNTDDFSIKIQALYPNILSNSNVVHDWEYVKLENIPTQLNNALLIELYKRTLRGTPILEEIEHYIYYMRNALPNFQA